MTASAEYIQLLAETTLPPAVEKPPFRAVVVVEREVSPEWQAAVSDWLIQSGCLYMMAWGQNCISWDDSVDFANMKKFDFGKIPETEFVMTTWHANESLQEVFWFAKNHGVHPTIGINRTLLVHISSIASKDEFLKAYADA